MIVRKLICDSCGQEKHKLVSTNFGEFDVFLTARYKTRGTPGEDLTADLCVPCQLLAAYALIDKIKEESPCT